MGNHARWGRNRYFRGDVLTAVLVVEFRLFEIPVFCLCKFGSAGSQMPDWVAQLARSPLRRRPERVLQLAVLRSFTGTVSLDRTHLVGETHDPSPDGAG